MHTFFRSFVRYTNMLYKYILYGNIVASICRQYLTNGSFRIPIVNIIVFSSHHMSPRRSHFVSLEFLCRIKKSFFHFSVVLLLMED